MCNGFLNKEDPEMYVLIQSSMYDKVEINLPALAAKVTTIVDILDRLAIEQKKNDQAYRIVERTWQSIKTDIFSLRMREMQIKPHGKTLALNLIHKILMAVEQLSPKLSVDHNTLGPRHPDYNRLAQLLNESAYLIDPL